jgi:hypothetical protein
MFDQWFSPGPPVSSTNKTDRHDIAEILLKVALNTIILSTTYIHVSLGYIARFTVNNHKLFIQRFSELNGQIIERETVV